MRVGLRGPVHKAWAPRGAVVFQEGQSGWSCLHVAVAIEPRTGQLWWAWQKHMKGEERVRIRGAWAEEPILKAWQADPQRVRQLCGWDWIRKALTALPADTQVS